MSLVIPPPDGETTVLLVHAPYPGWLKFDGEPSSLLYAVTPFVHGLLERGFSDKVGLLDPRMSSEEFYGDLRRAVTVGQVRAVCISTSSAAIEETARVVETVRSAKGERVLIVVGGPHEDDCEEKVALRMEGVDLSMGGEPEYLLDQVLREFLEGERGPREFCGDLEGLLPTARLKGGEGEVSSPWWPEPRTRRFNFGPIDLDTLPPRCRSHRPVRFSPFGGVETIPVMLSRGCAYGLCTFCAEGLGQKARVLSTFGWLKEILHENPGSALYFQDSIFPGTRIVREQVLPLLREGGVEWGCQVYLPMLSEAFVRSLAEHGCRYLYTGLESADETILQAIGKGGLRRDLLLQRLGWIRDHGMSIGLSVMFGALGDEGELLETTESIEATVALCHDISVYGLEVSSFYPNVETVLPGTLRAKSLTRAGINLDWYRTPRTIVFEALEDGALGFNFLSTSPRSERRRRLVIADRVRHAASELLKRSGTPW